MSEEDLTRESPFFWAIKSPDGMSIDPDGTKKKGLYINPLWRIPCSELHPDCLFDHKHQATEEMEKTNSKNPKIIKVEIREIDED